MIVLNQYVLGPSVIVTQKKTLRDHDRGRLRNTRVLEYEKMTKGCLREKVN